MDEIDPTTSPDGDGYKVGRGKPPKNGQFKPGQSGHPGGRRKGSRNLMVVVNEVLSDVVELTINGKKRSVPTVEALVMRQVQEGLRGQLRAIESLLDRYERYSGTQAQADEELSADDKEILRRLRGARARTHDEPSAEAEAVRPGEAGDD